MKTADTLLSAVFVFAWLPVSEKLILLWNYSRNYAKMKKSYVFI